MGKDLGKPVWQVRIEPATGNPVPLGAGTLVTDRHVITCRHVVGELKGLHVAFPWAPRFGVRKAEVVYRGPWEAPDDDGDVAVLELAEPVDASAAATLAAPEDRPAGTLSVCGFPSGSNRGVYARVRADFAQDLYEWIHLEVAQAHLQRLERGFSGGAVFDPASGKVFGMVTDGGRQVANGRMLSVDGLRKYWEDLDDLLPLGWLDAADRRSLRMLVRDVETDLGLEEIYERVFPGHVLYGTFRSVWDSIRYVAEEQFGEDRLRTYLEALAGHLPDQAAESVRSWTRSRFGAPAPPVSEDGPPAVVVRIVKETRAYGLEIFTLVDGRAGPRLPRQELKTARQVRERVQERLPEMIMALAHRVPVIEFMLPENWLSKPVEEWRIGGRPLRDFYPVVVRDVYRVQRATWGGRTAGGKAMRYGQAMQRWQGIDHARRLDIERVGCRHPHLRKFSTWLGFRADLGALAYGFEPRDQLAQALDHGVPVMLWPRSLCRCEDDDQDGCPGDRFLAGVLDSVGSVPAAQLPHRVKELRAEAVLLEDPAHCGHALTLFWDDPRRVAPSLGA